MLDFGIRSAQAENFDAIDRTAEQIQKDYLELRRVNRIFRLEEPFLSLLSARFRKEENKARSILDIGAGDGSLGDSLRRCANQKGWLWKITNLDQHEAGFQLRSTPDPSVNVTGSALDLPFPDRSFDAVIASQMTHHLEDDAAVIRHFQEAWRVTRGTLIICDLVRSRILYWMIRITTPIFGLSREMREDGRISVLRSFRVDEWKRLAKEAGLPDPDIRVYYGTRLTLVCDRKGE